MLGGVMPHLLSLAGLPHRKEPLPLTPELRVPHPLCYMSFFSVAYLLFRFFFLLGGGQSVQGAMLIFLKGGCERTACCLFLTCGSAKQVRSQHLAAWEPSCFSIFCDMGKLCGEAMCGLVVQRCQHLASSWWFFLSVVSPASQENFYFKEHTLSASSL
jgi:hypothetical protein